MFERRLKIVLLILVLVSVVLLGRVFAVQVVGHTYWTRQTLGLLTRPQITETTRGRIFDSKNRLMAEDTACTDACVDYRAIVDPPDPAWITEIATTRLKNRLGTEYRKAHTEKTKSALKTEETQVRSDIATMWETLATLYEPTDGGQNVDRMQAMQDIRKGIVQTVEARRQSLRARNAERTTARASTSSKWIRWVFASGTTTAPADDVVIEEQKQPHVILHALDSDGCNFLGKKLEDFPGLVLRASTHRRYPLQTVAAHLMGRISRVSATDLKLASQLDLDDGRQYLANDLIGREGVEALCEPLLRGTRGRIEKEVGSGIITSEVPFQPGTDVHLSIDAHLQELAQNMLQHVRIVIDEKPTTPDGGVSMHAAAVVLDVRTNQVLVLASNPGFDVNDLETRYAALVDDVINEPLRNRATCDELEPGSTVKPLLGLGAITQGTIGIDDTIDCTGVLYLPEVGPDGIIRRKRMPGGRCWILSEFGPELKKRGLKDNHGPLNFAGALERSCDIFFETVADRLGPQGVNRWYDQFGLGRITGIGIRERPGLRSGEWKGLISDPRMNNCYSGMGEGTSWATPLQVANEAATIARGGKWMRPQLLSAESQAALDRAHPRSSDSPPDVIDLHLDPEAVRQAKIGMRNVVDGPAGTGKIDHPAWLSVAAKTGTADTSPLAPIKLKDANGQIVLRKLVPVIRDQPETDTPWYRSHTGKTEVHAWYMGFAPVEHPQIAFCVAVEYAGAGGGPVAGPIVSQILEACVQDGYLHADQ